MFKIGSNKLILYWIAEVIHSLHNAFSPISIQSETSDEESLFKHYECDYYSRVEALESDSDTSSMSKGWFTRLRELAMMVTLIFRIKSVEVHLLLHETLRIAINQFIWIIGVFYADNTWLLSSLLTLILSVDFHRSVTEESLVLEAMHITITR